MTGNPVQHHGEAERRYKWGRHYYFPAEINLLSFGLGPYNIHENVTFVSLAEPPQTGQSNMQAEFDILCPVTRLRLSRNFYRYHRVLP